ncbi:MAG: dynamin family protein [Terriglobales bacterium]
MATKTQVDSRAAVDFSGVKSAILARVASVRQVAEERKDANAISELAALDEKLSTNRFYLAVLGQFKRGKTTLINGLLGADVLPVAVVPLTSIITMLSYGERPEVTVHFLSGETRPSEMEELEQYVTERHNPENRKGVKHVDVRYPSPYLKDGILLVDTPGVGSTYQHNSEVTHSFLAHVDAAIFMVSVDPPLTQAEAEFLRRAKEEVHHFFFVLNKIDLMTETDMQESLSFSRAQIERQAGLAAIELFPMSARMALEAKKAGDEQRLHASGLVGFEDALRRFLMKDKGLVLLESSLSDVLRVAGDLRFAIEVEVKAAAVPLAELQEKQHLLETELEKIEQERNDMNVLLAAEVNRLVGEVESDLNRRVEESIPSVRKQLQEFYTSHAGAGRGELDRLLDDFMTGEVEQVFNAWRVGEDHKMNKVFLAMSSRFAEKTNAIIRNIRGVTSRLFDIGVETFESPEALRAEAHLYYKVDPLFYFTIEKIPFVLPKFLFRSYVLSKMQDKIKMELHRNAGRIRYDYLERIEKSSNEFRKALNLKIDATLTGIRQAIERAISTRRTSSQEYERQMADYRQCSQELEAIVQDCKDLLRQVAA